MLPEKSLTLSGMFLVHLRSCRCCLHSLRRHRRPQHFPPSWLLQFKIYGMTKNLFRVFTSLFLVWSIITSLLLLRQLELLPECFPPFFLRGVERQKLSGIKQHTSINSGARRTTNLKFIESMSCAIPNREAHLAQYESLRAAAKVSMNVEERAEELVCKILGK